MLQRMREGIGRWLAGAILVLIAVAFVFWGIDFNLTGAGFAARVNGEEIALEDFNRELQAQQSQYQELYQVDLTEELRQQLRRNVIDRMIRTEALRQRVLESGYRVSDERLAESIRSIPMFQVGGEFSMDVYRSQLLYQGFSPSQFEAVQRDQLALIDLQNGIAESTFLTPTEYRRFIELYNQQRQVGYALFPAAAFTEQAEVTEDEVVAHYEANPARYQSEETVDLEYVRLRLADIAADIEVTEEDLRAYYEQEGERYQSEEERRARHILIASRQEDAEAEARAEAALARIEAGEEFAAVAGEVSEDPGTAAQGGDLGWVGRGMLAGPFEDALYSMEVGEVAGPVRTAFGYHVIRLDEIRAEEVQSFEQVREELEQELSAQRAEDLFFERANELADRAFDAYDELATVAAEMELPLNRLEGFGRSGAPDVFPNSAPVVRAAFSADVLEERLNSDLIELGSDDVVVLRVAEHHPSTPQPLDEVREQIRGDLVRAGAQRLASASAEAFLAALPVQAGEDEAPPRSEAEADGAAAGDEAAAEADAEPQPAADPRAALAETHGGTWHPPAWVERTSGDVPTEVLSRAFQLDKPVAGPIRELVSTASGDQAVLVLSDVRPGQPEAIQAETREQRLRQRADQAAMYELAAYSAEVRNEASVAIPEQTLNPPTF